MSEPKWAEDKGRVDGELERLDQDQREMRKEFSDMNGQLHKKLNENGITLAVIKNDVATLIKTNGKSVGGVTKGQLLLATTVITGLFGLLAAMIRWW